MSTVGSCFVGTINSAVVMTADGSAGCLLAERLVVTVGVMIAEWLVSSPLAARLVGTVCFRHRWCLLTTVVVAPMLSASRLASKVCYTIKHDIKYWEHIIWTYNMHIWYEHSILYVHPKCTYLVLGWPFACERKNFTQRHPIFVTPRRRRRRHSWDENNTTGWDRLWCTYCKDI